MRFSRTELGVWFNGKERLNIKKYEKNGKVFLYEIPDIPHYGQGVEYIGLYKRKDLIKPTSLKSTLKDTTRNFLCCNNKSAIW